MDLVVGALATAAVLGVTHAVEPDHVAGVAATAGPAARPRRGALIGACFGAGHVVLVLAWLVGGYLLLGTTAAPAVFDRLGTAGVAALLGVLGAILAVSGLRALARRHARPPDHEPHADPHLHLPLGVERRIPIVGRDGDHDHDGVAVYLATGVVGALFTLSPPLSMLAFAATLYPTIGGGPLALAVGVYAVAITGAMALFGAGAGAVAGRLDGRWSAVARVVGGGAVAGLAIAVGTGLL